ncbi:MAG: hypothetical protein ACRCR9_04450 [Chitinophagaceae bacterium]
MGIEYLLDIHQEGGLNTSTFERGTVDISLSPTFLNNHLTLNSDTKGMLMNNRWANGGAIV